MTKSTTETTKKACSFPAISLRAYRSELTDEIKKLEMAGRGESQITVLLKAIMAIDKLYGDHQDIGGCSSCWWTPAETAIAGGCL